MEKELPLVSILVICYNNQQYIYENLKSIFEQTYQNLEILIGDDCSENFDAEKLIRWINQNRTKNIKHIAIYESEENRGTVANFERLQRESRGEYLFHIAADDALFDKDVIQSFYNKAAELGESGEFITAQTEMWDHELKNKIGDFLQEDWIELIKNGSARDIFGELSWHAILPACNFYRRELVEKIGSLSGTYRLVEDWPWALRMTRMGIKPYLLDIRSSIKHRDGGISHGNSLHSQRVFLTYYHDLLKGYATEVEPYEELLTEEERERARRYYQDRTRAYYRIHLPKYIAQCNEIQAEKAVPAAAARPQEQGGEHSKEEKTPVVQVKSEDRQLVKRTILREELKKTVFQLSSGTTVFCTFVAALLCIIARAQIASLALEKHLQPVFLCGAVVLLAAAAAEVALAVWLRLRHLRQRLNEH